jgi:hypothetical protein
MWYDELPAGATRRREPNEPVDQAHSEGLHLENRIANENILKLMHVLAFGREC